MDETPHLTGIFGVYLQVPDLQQSLAFYRDLLGLEVSWNDGTLALLHSRDGGGDTLVLRQTEDARHDLHEAGVTRVLWRVSDSADLDAVEEMLTKHEMPHQRHRDDSYDGVTVHDPDGLRIVLLHMGEATHKKAPPPWLYWQR